MNLFIIFLFGGIIIGITLMTALKFAEAKDSEHPITWKDFIWTTLIGALLFAILMTALIKLGIIDRSML